MGFTELINENALNGVDLSQTMLLYNHDFGNILARADAGNLQLKVDGTGLFFDAQLPNTTLANDCVADIQAGNLKGCSFGFTLPDDGSGDTWTQDANGNLVHTINQIAEVIECSLTPIPAYTQTSVSVQRSLENFKKGVEEEKMTKEENEELRNSLKALQDEVRALKEKRDDDDNDDVETDSKDEPVDAKDSDAKDAKDSKEDKKDPEDKDTKDKDSENNKKRSKEQENPENKGEKRENMKKDITPEANKKSENVRNFEEFLKTGELKRDTVGGFDTTSGEAVIPSEVLDVMQQPDDPTQLSGYVTKVQVTAPTGKLPVLKKASAQLVSAAELADNPSIANATINPVTYDVSTLRGALPISIEMTQDYPNITALLSDYVNEVKLQTEQHKIGAVLQTAKAVAVTDADGIKDAYNVGLTNYGSDRIFVVSESFFAAVDKLKDDNGRYLFQDSISSASGKTLFGAELIVVADDVLGAAGDAKAFVGSVKAFVLEAIKANLNVAWVRNEQFEQVLQVVLRADFKVADADAGKFLTYTAPAK